MGGVGLLSRSRLDDFHDNEHTNREGEEYPEFEDEGEGV